MRDLFFLKKGIPTRRDKVSEYIKTHEDKFDKTNPGPISKEDKKEVEESEQRSTNKYREFEKLRKSERDRALERGTGKERKQNINPRGSEQSKGSGILQDGPNSRAKKTKSKHGGQHRKVNLFE